MGVKWLDAMLGTLPPDALDELLITSPEPLEVAHLATLKRAVKRLRLQNASLPLSTQSRMK